MKDKYVAPGKRPEPRVQGLRRISISYEGQKEEIVVKPPDLSMHGMFISTNRSFPEGAVLNLRFQLAHSGVQVETRGEVRYCLPGVGVGVEFVGVSREAEQEIAWEIECQTKGRNRGKRDSRRARERIAGKPAGRGAGQREFLLWSCATRALTIFLIRARGSGLPIGKWMVPLEVE